MQYETKGCRGGRHKTLSNGNCKRNKNQRCVRSVSIKMPSNCTKEKKDLNSQHREKKKTAKVILTKENHILYTI